MIQINWIKCSDRMPPDTQMVIGERYDGKYIKFPGYVFNPAITKPITPVILRWIAYDEATWRELNK